MKKFFSFFIFLTLFFLLFFSPSALMANQAKLNPLGLAKRAKQKVNEYHEKQKKQINQALSNIPGISSNQSVSQGGGTVQPESGSVVPAGQQASPSGPTSQNQASLEEATAAEEGETEEDETEDSSLRSVDYTSPTQIFYKRECPPDKKDCVRGAVLTNIKSVIFDYSKTRGSFMNPQPADDGS